MLLWHSGELWSVKCDDVNEEKKRKKQRAVYARFYTPFPYTASSAKKRDEPRSGDKTWGITSIVTPAAHMLQLGIRRPEPTSDASNGAILKHLAEPSEQSSTHWWRTSRRYPNMHGKGDASTVASCTASSFGWHRVVSNFEGQDVKLDGTVVTGGVGSAFFLAV